MMLLGLVIGNERRLESALSCCTSSGDPDVNSLRLEKGTDTNLQTDLHVYFLHKGFCILQPHLRLQDQDFPSKMNISIHFY